MTRNFIVVDIETTGISPENNCITEIGGLKIIDGQKVDTFSMLINPQTQVTPEITRITGLTNAMLDDQPTIDVVLPKFLEFNEDLPLLGQNILFDFSFLKMNANRLGYEFERGGMDTLQMANYYLPDLRSKSLTSLIDYFDINRELAHRAYHDAQATFEVYEFFYKDYRKEGEDLLFTERPLRWKPKKSSPITPKQKSFLLSLINKHMMFEDLDIEKLTKSEASRYIDNILFTKGRG